MREIMMDLLKPGSLLAAALSGLFGVNGYFRWKAEREDKRTAREAAAGAAVTDPSVPPAEVARHVANDPGIVVAWRDIVEELKVQNTLLKEQNEGTREENEELRKQNDLLRQNLDRALSQLTLAMSHINDLRLHINYERKPPAPAWPDGLNPLGYTGRPSI